MVNIVDIPILQKRFVVLIIGIIIGILLYLLINKNYPSFLNCNSTEKFTDTNKENPIPLNNKIIDNIPLHLPSHNQILDNIPLPSPNYKPYDASPLHYNGLMNACNNNSTNTQVHNTEMPEDVMPDEEMPDEEMPDEEMPVEEMPVGFITGDDNYANVPIVSSNNKILNAMKPKEIVPSMIPEPNGIDELYSMVAPTKVLAEMPMNNMRNTVKPRGINSNVVPGPNDTNNPYPSVAPIKVLTQEPIKEQFEEQIPASTRKPIKIYNFNTSWCGWSKKFQPEWDNFMSNIKSNNKLNSLIDVRDIKCDTDDNKQLCSDNNVDGYPTVKINVNGKNIDYKGGRTSDDLMKSVNDIINNMQ